MEQTLVAAAEDAPREADLAFDRLYRSSRDDVYAYAYAAASSPPRSGWLSLGLYGRTKLNHTP